MPRKSEGARLWLKQTPSGGVWIIKDDGGVRRSTGCREDDRAGAEKALAEHLAAKHNPAADEARSLEDIQVADVINLYARDVGPSVARPDELAARLERLLDWWGSKTLADVKRASCLAYAASRPRVAARRELEDLRAAIGHYISEGKLRYAVAVALPDKPPARQRWMTREEVARLLLHCWTHREEQRGAATRRHTRRHIARFILVGIYTGTRSGAICGASFEREAGYGWVDLEGGASSIAGRRTRARPPSAGLR